MKRNVCVLMSTYNGEKYLKEQIDSILNQKNVNVRLIVRDDGSKDATIDILKEYENEKKLRWYNGKNLGPAKSFMDLVFNADECDYYAFADQDDFWMEDKLEKTLEKIGNNFTPMVAYCNAEIVNSKLESLNKLAYSNKQYNFYTLMCANYILGCTMVFNNALRKIIVDAGKPKNIVMHDAYLIRVCLAIGGQVIFNNKIEMKYRQHENNVMGIKINFPSKLKSFNKEIFKKSDITIDEQADDLIEKYDQLILNKNKKWMQQVSMYRKCLWNRIRLACSMKISFKSIKESLKFRMAILLGHR